MNVEEVLKWLEIASEEDKNRIENYLNPSKSMLEEILGPSLEEEELDTIVMPEEYWQSLSESWENEK